MKRPNVIQLILAIIALGCIGVGGGYIYHFRPLIRASPLKARVTHATFGATEASVYQMLFRPNQIFIEVPETHRDRYSWFAIDMDRKAVGVPNGPRRKPYLHQNHDMNLGVNLRSQKIEDTWVIDWAGRSVTFANSKLRIELGMD